MFTVMLPLTLGIVLLVLVALDALWTTLWVNGGAGPFSGRFAAALWWGLRRATPEGRDWPASIAGPVILFSVVVGWVALLWAGWTLVYSSDPGALSYSSTGERPDLAGRIYFTGYTFFTLGIGNVVPARGTWEVVTALASASGLLLITLAISYVLAVLGAVVSGRAFAVGVGGLGDDAEEVVARAWDGAQYSGLALPLSSLSSQLDRLGQQHLAFPVLYYYHARNPDAAPALAVAVLDEALTILRFGVPEAYRPPASILEGARSSVASYLGTHRGAHVAPADTPPRPPDLERLRAAGLPTVSDTAFAEALDELTERRRSLLGMVEVDARTWPPARP
jgi:hypothetical protein